MLKKILSIILFVCLSRLPPVIASDPHPVYVRLYEYEKGHFKYSKGLPTSSLSPNADGIKDKLFIEYEVPAFAGLPLTDFKVSIFNLESGDVRLFEKDTLSIRNGHFIWDGCTNDGSVAPYGKYIISVRGTNSNGTEYYGSTSVDLRRNDLGLIGKVVIIPNPVKNPAEPVSILCKLSGPCVFTVKFKGGGSKILWQGTVKTKGNVTETLTWDAKVDGKPLPDGGYGCTIDAVDSSGYECHIITSRFLRIEIAKAEFDKTTLGQAIIRARAGYFGIHLITGTWGKGEDDFGRGNSWRLGPAKFDVSEDGSLIAIEDTFNDRLKIHDNHGKRLAVIKYDDIDFSISNGKIYVLSMADRTVDHRIEKKQKHSYTLKKIVNIQYVITEYSRNGKHLRKHTVPKIGDGSAKLSDMEIKNGTVVFKGREEEYKDAYWMTSSLKPFSITLKKQTWQPILGLDGFIYHVVNKRPYTLKVHSKDDWEMKDITLEESSEWSADDFLVDGQGDIYVSNFYIDQPALADSRKPVFNLCKYNDAGKLLQFHKLPAEYLTENIRQKVRVDNKGNLYQLFVHRGNEHYLSVNLLRHNILRQHGDKH